ncbi:MAG: aquaporin [bacterium]|nr:aquaporin [bacterium]
MSQKLLKESLVEFIGTFILVFIGGLSVVLATSIATINVLVPAFAHGLTVMGIIYAYGHISGAHINPAVTLGLFVGGRITLSKALFYIVAQFLGSLLAPLLIIIILGSNANLGETTGTLTENNIWQAALLEAILTFILVCVIFQAGIYGKAGNLAGIVIGLTLTGLILAGGVFTGASLNPARTFGPAAIAGNFEYILPYFLGIFGGGALAGLFNSTVMKP